MNTIYQEIAGLEASARGGVVCTIILTEGSSPRKAGTKMLVRPDGSIHGTIGGGLLEKACIEEALRVMEDGRPRLFGFDLSEDRDMNCGGKVQVFLEPICNSRLLYIFGGGHVGSAVARLALNTGFQVSILDDRPPLPEPRRLPACHYLNGDYPALLDSLPLDGKGFGLITTGSHVTDELLLSLCIRKPWTYLGMIGSKKKVAHFREKLLAAKIAEAAELDKVNMPAGIPFNAQSPEEIAISIMAKIIDVKNQLG